ncbi:MAG: hypothetical protein ACMUEM_07730 [Flavobacteriales bacterium AspAUS03]
MDTLLKVHHYLAFLTLILLVSISIYAVYVRLNGSSSLQLGKFLSTVTILSLHIQTLLGFVLMDTYNSRIQESVILMSDIMKDAELRYRLIEHPFMMALAVTLATLAHVKLKKEAFSHKVMTLFILALIFLLIRIPFHLLFS